ncbi:hypothetical protein LINPERPRIM_LOCUS3603, partial [Linum perenne]
LFFSFFSAFSPLFLFFSSGCSRHLRVTGGSLPFLLHACFPSCFFVSLSDIFTFTLFLLQGALSFSFMEPLLSPLWSLRLSPFMEHFSAFSSDFRSDFGGLGYIGAINLFFGFQFKEP